MVSFVGIPLWDFSGSFLGVPCAFLLLSTEACRASEGIVCIFVFVFCYLRVICLFLRLYFLVSPGFVCISFPACSLVGSCQLRLVCWFQSFCGFGLDILLLGVAGFLFLYQCWVPGGWFLGFVVPVAVWVPVVLDGSRGAVA